MGCYAQCGCIGDLVSGAGRLEWEGTGKRMKARYRNRGDKWGDER